MNNKGIALLTVLMVMIMGIILIGLITYLCTRGYQTYGSAKNYNIALQMAQGGIEEAIIDLETKTYGQLQNLINNNPQTGDPGDPNDFYEIWQVFWKPLSGFKGVPVFPPISGAYTGVAGVGIYYLVHSQATKHNSQADLYIMYVKGY